MHPKCIIIILLFVTTSCYAQAYNKIDTLLTLITKKVQFPYGMLEKKQSGIALLKFCVKKNNADTAFILNRPKQEFFDEVNRVISIIHKMNIAVDTGSYIIPIIFLYDWDNPYLFDQDLFETFKFFHSSSTTILTKPIVIIGGGPIR